MPGFELIGEEEKRNILRLFELKSDFERGPVVKEFQANFARLLNVKYAQAVSSCTAALKVAVETLELEPGSEIITSAFTFVATAEAILEAKCIPVFAEIDETYNLDPDDVLKKITSKTRAIIPVHMYGAPANMDEILKIAREYDLKIIEDTAQALGSKYNSKWSGTIGDIGCFSFDSGKAVGTGEGGMVVSNNEVFWRRAFEYYDHGHQSNPALPRGRDTCRRYGFNFRMTELSAAVGLAQLEKLRYLQKKQKENYLKIEAGIADKEFYKLRKFNPGAEHTYEALVFSLPSRQKVEELYSILKDKKIITKNLPDAYNWHFAGCWEQIIGVCPNYKGMVAKDLFKKSADLLSRSIALMIFCDMSDVKISEITGVLNEFSASARM